MPRGRAQLHVGSLVHRQQVVPGRGGAGLVHDTESIVDVGSTGPELRGARGGGKRGHRGFDINTGVNCCPG